MFLVGFEVAEIEAILATAKANLLSGTIKTTWAVGESSAGNIVTVETAKVLDECQYALRRLAPDKYPPAITRTKAEL